MIIDKKLTLNDIKVQLHNYVLQLRQIAYFLDKIDVPENLDLVQLLEALDSTDIDKIKILFGCDLSYRILRRKAMEHGIANYSRMTKAELLQELFHG